MRKIVLILAMIMLALPARASEGVIASVLGNARLSGEATFRWLGLPLYTARLFLPGGQRFSWSEAMALQLSYARGISRQSLLDATVSELERLEGSQADHRVIGDKLAPCFRDVGEGDQFIATTTDQNEIRLFFNGAATCTVRHPNLGPRFMAIWLSDQSRSPGLSRRLRGGQ